MITSAPSSTHSETLSENIDSKQITLPIFPISVLIVTHSLPAEKSEDIKVNMVNHRREFFHVTLNEIKEVIKKNFDKTVEFIDIPDAEQYRVSEKMRNCKN